MIINTLEKTSDFVAINRLNKREQAQRDAIFKTSGLETLSLQRSYGLAVNHMHRHASDIANIYEYSDEQVREILLMTEVHGLTKVFLTQVMNIPLDSLKRLMRNLDAPKRESILSDYETNRWRLTLSPIRFKSREPYVYTQK